MSSKAYKISYNQLKDFKYFYIHHLAGLVGTLVEGYGLKLDQDLIEDMKLAICDVFEGGCEPEFKSDNHGELWNSLSPESFEEYNDSYYKSKHYRWSKEAQKLL